MSGCTDRGDLPPWQARGAACAQLPARRLYHSGTLINRSPLLQHRLRGAVAEFNLQDAEQLGLESGTLVNASLGARTKQLTAQINPRVPEGVVLVPDHLPAGPLTITIALLAAT